MKSHQGRSCRKAVRHFEHELAEALLGRAITRNGELAEKGVLPRSVSEIEADLVQWRGLLAAPVPPPDDPVVERPHCRHCNRLLAPLFERVTVRHDIPEGHYSTEEKTGKVIGFGYRARGYFCTATCGWSFAVALLDKETHP